MIGLKLDPSPVEDKPEKAIPVQFHSSFVPTYKFLNRWLERFDGLSGEAVMNDLILFYSLAKRKHLDHRTPAHLARVILSINYTRRKLLNASALKSSTRHSVTRWIPTDLIFPFSSKAVMGCLIGFNIMDRCELFDEESIIVSLQKHFPDFQFVKESYYSHSSQDEGIRICYFEVEKKDGSHFTLTERKLISKNFKNKMQNSIQRLIPSMFMKLNQEEVYKNILILSQEISSVNDLPQVSITLDQHTAKEIAFHITLVQIAPFHRFSFKERILGCSIVLDRIIPVRHLDGHQVEASLFKLLLPHEPSLVRSDGSLDFYAARQKVSQHLQGAIGEFRDYNGGLLIKQQELLFSFKESLPPELSTDTELTENFFHALVPLEKQALLDPSVLSELFKHYIIHRKKESSNGLSFDIINDAQKTFILVRSNDPSISETISGVLRNYLPNTKEWAYNLLKTSEETAFNCVLLNSSSPQAKNLIHAIEKAFHEWSQKRQDEQVLRIALSHSMYSLDPRSGGEVSSEVIKLLYERLTRISDDGHVENAAAESIHVSPDLKKYTFKLRTSFWNDGSLVSAHDFAYSWKRILSPDFKTSFATYFYPIKNAKEAKEGKVSPEKIGIHVVDDRTLQIDLARPTPYFLQLTALPIYSPIHRFVDKERPQWPYQAEDNYPCNGPFKLKVNQPNQTYVLEKNPLHWDAAHTELEKVSLSSMDPFEAMQAFGRGEVDWVGDPFGPWPSSMPEDGRTISSINSRLCWLTFNTTIAPFNHPKVRRALALAIDRSELIAEAAQPWTPAYSVLFPHHSNREHKVFPECDREKASMLLEEALKEIGLLVKDLTVQLAFTQRSVLEPAAHILKKQFESTLGIQCELQSFSWNAFFRKITEGQCQTDLANWATPIKDPISTLNAFKFAKDGVSFSHWESTEFQKMLDLSEEEISPFQRSSYLYKAEEILAKAAPVIPLFYQPDQAVIRKSFQIKSHPNGPDSLNQIRTMSKRR